MGSIVRSAPHTHAHAHSHAHTHHTHTGDGFDKAITPDDKQWVVWAIGPVGNVATPSGIVSIPFKHYLRPSYTGTFPYRYSTREILIINYWYFFGRKFWNWIWTCSWGWMWYSIVFLRHPDSAVSMETRDTGGDEDHLSEDWTERRQERLCWDHRWASLRKVNMTCLDRWLLGLIK